MKTKYATVSFMLFPSCGHIVITDDDLQTVDPNVRNLELILRGESDICTECSKPPKNFDPVDHLLKRAGENRSKLLEESKHATDAAALNSNRWALDVEYIRSVIQGHERQLKKPVIDIVYQNHLHNAERRRHNLVKQWQEDKLDAMQEGTYKDPERWIRQKHLIELDLARMQGEYFGRIWADENRPKPEKKKATSSVCPVTGDISIIFSQTETQRWRSMTMNGTYWEYSHV